MSVCITVFGVGVVRYRHIGVTTEDGVDLRAEVGLLSRNIKIHGEVEKSCYADNLCEYFDQDTFGGHIQVGRPRLTQDQKMTDLCASTALIQNTAKRIVGNRFKLAYTLAKYQKR